MSTKILFGGTIALILLGLYVYLVVYAVMVVLCVTGTNCTSGLTLESFTRGMASGLATIGGLVSALVIAELAITKPGAAPAARLLTRSSSQGTQSSLKIVTFSYLAVWLLTGLVAYIVGPLLHEETLRPLTDLGQSWLGLAVAAGYAYLGINPNGSNG